MKHVSNVIASRVALPVAFVFLCMLAVSISANTSTPLQLSLTDTDVVDSLVESNQVWLKLSDNASLKLHELTKDNIGKRLVLTWKDVNVVDMAISVAVASGTVYIAEPSSELISLLESR